LGVLLAHDIDAVYFMARGLLLKISKQIMRRLAGGSPPSIRITACYDAQVQWHLLRAGCQQKTALLSRLR